MAKVFMIDPDTGRAAFYDEPATGGSPSDPNAARNKPLNSPYAWLDKIYFHSDFDYLEVVASGTATINHATVAAAEVPVQTAALDVPFSYRKGNTSHLIHQHNLGYRPFVLIGWGDNILWPGAPVQFNSNGGRYITPYVSTTQVRIYEWSMAKGTISAATRGYSYIVFRQPRPASGKTLMNYDPDTGIVSMGLGKFRSDRRYLQVVPGGSPLGFHRGRCIDLNNGAPRFINPDGSVYDPIPATAGIGLDLYNQSSRDFSTSAAYRGTFAGQPGILVQAP